ncbi:hypothetical protein DFH09DRAFT_1126880 [Mycena vulgaris]|nr:hypothetical protein DFH09DRAFT_1126880 [Mycena vulgaris]
MDTPMPSVHQHEDSQDDYPMAEDSSGETEVVSLLRIWIGLNKLVYLAAKTSNDNLWRRLASLPPLEEPLSNIIYEGDNLKDFHPLASQLTYTATEDLPSYIAELWGRGNLMGVDCNAALPKLLREWLADSEDELVLLVRGSEDISMLRQLLSDHARPSEPLLSNIFHSNRLKPFTFPDRRRGDEDVYAHLVALWEPSSELIGLLEKSAIARSKLYKERLHSGMERKFVGVGAAQFAAGMKVYRGMWEEDQALYYGKIVPMAAPSGLGKTKVLLEYLLTHPALYISFRSPNNSPAQSWPPGDKPITAFFSKFIAKPSALVCAALLAALMECACETYSSDLDPAEAIANHNEQWKHKLGSRSGSDLRAENLRKLTSKAEELLIQKEGAFKLKAATSFDHCRKNKISLISRRPDRAL